MKTAIAAALLAVLAATAEAEGNVRAVGGDLPGEAEFEALGSIEDLADGDIALVDLNMLPLAWPSVMQPDGTYITLQTCDFGMIENVEKVSVPTGSNHLLMSVWIGNREDHPANGLSCEYAPIIGGEAPQDWARMRLTGCYLVRDVSIPTARELVLNPLPATACGLHD